MYQEFIVTIAKWIVALDTVQQAIEEKEGLTPYLGKIEVMLSGEIVGHIVDDGDVGFSYEPLTDRSST